MRAVKQSQIDVTTYRFLCGAGVGLPPKRCFRLSPTFPINDGGDVGFAFLHSLSDRLREDAQEQVFGPLLLELELVMEMFGINRVAHAQEHVLKVNWLTQEIVGARLNSH